MYAQVFKLTISPRCLRLGLRHNVLGSVSKYMYSQQTRLEASSPRKPLCTMEQARLVTMQSLTCAFKGLVSHFIPA